LKKKKIDDREFVDTEYIKQPKQNPYKTQKLSDQIQEEQKLHISSNISSEEIHQNHHQSKAESNVQVEKKEFECEIHFETTGAENYLGDLPCQHNICRDCALHWARTEIRSNRLPRCPICLKYNSKTIQTIPETILRHICDDALIRNYQSVAISNELNFGSGNISYSCPYPSCSYCEVLNPNNKNMKFECPNCSTTSCAICQEYPYHSDYTCEQRQQAIISSIQQA